MSGDAFARRQPHAEHAGEDRETTRFAGSEEETNDPEGDDVPGGSGQSGKGRPADHDLQQDSADADLIAQQADGNFEQGVGEAKGAEDQPHLRLVEVQIMGDGPCGLRNSNALHVGEDGEPDGQCDNAVPRSTRLHLQALVWRGKNPPGQVTSKNACRARGIIFPGMRWR